MPSLVQAGEVEGISWLKTHVITTSTLANDLQSQTEVRHSLSLLNQPLGSPVDISALLADEHSTEMLARAAILAMLQQQNPSVYLTELKAAQNEDGGFGHLDGWQSNALDTAYALIALNETHFIEGLTVEAEKQQWKAIQSRALGYLKTQQRADGSYQVLSLDKLYVSAYVLNALSKTVAINADITANVIALVNFLETAQTSPGQWSGSKQGLFIDALVAEALHPFHDASHQNMEAAFRQRILSQQQSNGSWQADPYTTALILRSLKVQSMAAVNPVASGIQLQVIDAETGLAVPGVTLSSTNPVFSQSSDINGQISFTSVPTGQIQFSLQRNGYAAMQFDLTLRQGEQLNLGQIKLSRAVNVTTAQIQGRVLDAVTGAGVAGARVTVVMVDSNGHALPDTAPQVTLTNGDGSYQVMLNHGGNFGIDIRKTGYAPIQSNGSVPNGNIAVFSPKLNTLANNMASAQGRVVDGNGQPVAGVSLLDGSTLVATTDAQGLFSITNAQAGNKQWLFRKPGYLQATVSVALKSGENLNIGTINLPAQIPSTDPNAPAQTRVATGNIVVKATDSINHENINNISIIAELLDGQNNVIQQQSFQQNESLVNSSLLTLPAGKWRITVHHPAYQSTSQLIDLTASQTINYQPALTLNAYAVTGVVVNSLSNKPVANAPVKLINGHTKAIIYTGQTDANGRFTTPVNIAVQDVQIEINPTSYLSTTRFISRDALPESTVDLGEIRLRPQSAEIILPDLAITDINGSIVQTDLQTLSLNGTITTTITNKGNADFNNSPVMLTAFEDSNFNRLIDAGEQILGSVEFNRSLAVKATAQVIIPVKGKAQFRDAPIAVIVDSQNTVAEKDRKNNVRLSSDGVEIKPKQGTRDAEVVWFNTVNGSWTTPVAAPLQDTNGDGKIGQGDVATIIYKSYQSLYALDGRDGHIIWSVPLLSSWADNATAPVIADIDRDGLPDIITLNKYYLSVYSNSGQLKKNIPISVQFNVHSAYYQPSVADLNGDGTPEIVIGPYIIDYFSGIKAEFDAIATSAIIVADIDHDGSQEIITNNTVLKYVESRDQNGVVKAQVVEKFRLKYSLFAAVADLFNTGQPNIITTGNQAFDIYDNTGYQLAHYPVVDQFRGGPPVIADFDGDGFADMGVAESYHYTVMRSDGSIIWSKPIEDNSALTGSSVFDFDNDGKSEVVYADEQYFRIFDAASGAAIDRLPNQSLTVHEYPIVIDADADGHADIIFVGHSGVRMISGKNRDWANTRNIWNQYNYHVTDINDDLSVPTHEVNSWEAHNTYRANLLLNQNATAAADLTTSYLRFKDSGIFSPSQLTARIGNAGGKDVAAGTPVSFYRIPPAVNGVAGQPQLLKTVTLSKPLLAGHFDDLSIDYAGDMSNFGELVVVANDAGAGLDSLTGIPLNAPNNGGVIQEYTRANNLARLSFGSGFQSYSLDGGLDQASYKAGDTVTIRATPTNLGSLPSDVIIKTRIVDSGGNVVANLPDQTATLAGSLLGDGSNSKTLTLPWAVGQSRAGNYRVVIELLRNGWLGQDSVATLERSFSIASSASSTGLTRIAAQVDRTRYQAGDTVQITSRLQNTASNEVTTARSVTLEVLDPAGKVIWSQTSNYAALAPNALVDQNFSLSLKQVAAGSYSLRATQHAPDGSQPDQTVTRSFSVLGASQSGVGISGKLQAAASVEVGSPIALSWSLTNAGNAAINAINTRIILIDSESGNLIGNPVYSGSQSMAAGSTTASQIAQWISSGNPEQRITAILQVQLNQPELPEAERWKTLASTPFKLTVPPLKVAFGDGQKTAKPLLVYYSCHEGWWDVLSGWILGRYNYSCFDERERHIKSYLERINVPYTMVREPWQFRDKLHSGLYGQYWLLGAVEQLSAHTYKEVRESAHLGDNLLSDNGLLSWQNANLLALAGSRYRGRIQLSDGTITPQIQTQPANANLPALLTKPATGELSTIPLQTTTARKGQTYSANWPVLLEPLTSATQTSATFNGSKRLAIWLESCLEAGAKPNSYYNQVLASYPAVSMAPYGRGKPVALAFDLPASLSAANTGKIPLSGSPATLPQKRWDYALSELLVNRQSEVRSSYVPSEPVQIPVSLDNQSNQERTVQVSVELPAGAVWLGRQGGTQSPATAAAQGKVTYTLKLAANSKSTELLALRLPTTAGTHAVRSSVASVTVTGTSSSSPNTSVIAQQENRYVVRTLDERVALLKQSINGWNSSAGASWLELSKLKTDLLLLDTYYRLGQWELAILQTGHVSDDLAGMQSSKDAKITSTRIEVDELLRGLEIKWYLQRNGQRLTP